MNQQELQSLRALIASHKRWDFLFGVIGVLALMVGVMTFVALFADDFLHRLPSHNVNACCANHGFD